MALSTTLLRSVRSTLTRSFSIGTLSNPSLTVAQFPPIAPVRSFHTTNTVYGKPTTPYESHDDVLIRNNPFRLPTTPLEGTTTRDSFCFRIDMPGIGEGDLKWWVEGNSVYLEAKGSIGSKYEDSGRSYRMSFVLVPGACHFKTVDISAYVEDGVVRVKVPVQEPDS